MSKPASSRLVINLDPYFISKFEMTQGQWERVTHTNPSGRIAGRAGVDTVDPLLHAVETVSWELRDQILARMELLLPTEAQRQRAARGGTGSVWWCGNLLDPLNGKENLADRFTKENGGAENWSYELSLYDGRLASAPVRRITNLLALILFILTGCTASGVSKERFTFSRVAMGVEARIVLFADSSDSATSAAQAAFARLEEVESALSDYRVVGELARVHKAAGGEAIIVSHDLGECLGVALDVAEKSNGVFDPTLGALTQLWRKSRDSGALPSSSELARARALVNFHNVQFIAGDPPRLGLKREFMRLDFGGVGKGFGAEKALAVLTQSGIKSAMVAIAGDIALGEAPPGTPGWKINITNGRSSAPRVLELERCGVSTSGDSGQQVVIGGVSYAHIVDVTTGLGSTSLRPVTVIAKRPSLADAWATALSVGGEPALRAAEAAIERHELISVTFH